MLDEAQGHFLTNLPVALLEHIFKVFLPAIDNDNLCLAENGGTQNLPVNPENCINAFFPFVAFGFVPFFLSETFASCRCLVEMQR